MKALFVCNFNVNRSKTAEHLFKDKFKTKSAGLFGGGILTEDILRWADVVFVMDEDQEKEVCDRFPFIRSENKIVCLNISNSYYYNSPDLIELLNKRMKEQGF